MLKTMPTRYVRTMLRLLPEDQHTEILQQVDLDLEQIHQDTLVTVAQYAQLFALVLNRVQLVLHGTEAGPIQRFSCYRLILESMSQAPDLAQALERETIFFRRLVNDQESMTVRVDDTRVSLHFRLPQEQPAGWPLEYFSRDDLSLLPGLIGHATLLWIWHRLLSWLIGSYIVLDAVEFTEPMPSHPKKYEQLFSAEVNFQQPQAALVFSKSYLDYPIVQNTASVDHLLETFLLPLFEIDQRDKSITSQVETLIGCDFSHPIPSFDKIADRLHTTVPTLHRRLQKEGSSYQKVKDACRKQAAIDLLLNSELPIRVLAEQLGFSDSGTFHRAFRKWMGVTPAAFRRGDKSIPAKKGKPGERQDRQALDSN